MKFNCGLTRTEKVDLAWEEVKRLNREEQPWVKVFAWLPIRVGKQDCRWFEYVEKRSRCYELGLKFLTSTWFAEPKVIEYRKIEK